MVAAVAVIPSQACWDPGGDIINVSAPTSRPSGLTRWLFVFSGVGWLRIEINTGVSESLIPRGVSHSAA